LLILVAAALHLRWLLHACPLDLAPDEAHYWDWSRHLDWSYYSKGPLVAWLIRLSCELFGSWSMAATGNLALAIRLPALVCGSLLLVSTYVLTVQVFRNEKWAVLVVAFLLTLPPTAAVCSLMTIDAPYTCCWGWALVFAYQAVFGKSRWAWPLTGLMVGLGILAKYTMVVFVPSLALFLLTSREHRRLLLGRGFWSMCLVGALCCVPIVVWNIAHDWVSLKHVGGLAGLRPDEPAWHWEGPLVYVGTQFGLLLGHWFVVWAAALYAHRPWQDADAGRRYLWWMSVPMFALFLAFSIKTAGGEPNWPVTAYVSGIVLCVPWLLKRMREHPSLGTRKITKYALVATCVFGLLVAFALHHSEVIHPALARVGHYFQPRNRTPLRLTDPTCRLRGWRDLAANVDGLRERLRSEGQEPVLAGVSWSLPGELGCYCAGQPTVYSVGRYMGDRSSQYDLWPGVDTEPERFRGQTFIIVGGVSDAVRQAFERIEQPIIVTHHLGDDQLALWPVYVCRGFRGFAPINSPQQKY
jgi:hypothetical protein